ncbi:SDR family oxidoreductase [Actinomadura opuntiae]|uniref:SDR family oxidoreductase n=1 Tax=Actinomadura sp. OS1-43 TaxID=604315 RepID=UPI00255AD5E9|nr:SDR family oxidoreductase [Actinomadura sp. OS1-43]MDL4814183.1 SDR family oxidoreductase [Actinomadura sp. OS1-43]
MILVTGGSGTVGSALLETLCADGHRVRAAYRAQRDVDRAVGAGRDAVRIDLGEPATLPSALQGVETVFLVGAMGPDQTRQELNLIEAAAVAGVPRVVKLSVWRADEELTPIAALHRPAELALQASGLGYTFLRPNFYMQNFTRQFAASIRTTGRFAQPRAHAPISFVDVRDIARVAAHVLTTDGHDGRVYALTGPEALTYDDAAEVLSRLLDRPVRFVGLSDSDARAAMLERGLPEYYADALIEVSRAYRNGGAETVTTTVRDLTGREPTSFEQFVRDHRAAFT